MIRNKKLFLRVAVAMICAGIFMPMTDITGYAKEGKTLPSAGFDFALNDNGTSVKSIKDETEASVKTKTSEELGSIKDSVTPQATSEVKEAAGKLVSPLPKLGLSTDAATEEEAKEEKVVEETILPSSDMTYKEAEREIDAVKEEEGFKNLVIARCGGWVNVRKEPSEEAEKVGKLYDKSAGEFIEEVDGWYKISSGSCTGFVKAEYCVTGEDAVGLAKEVGTRVCTVDTTTLYVRAEATTESACLGMVPLGEVLTVSEEIDGWAKVNIEEGDGYVSLDYVKLSTEFVKAESKEEEEARLAKEARERQAAIEAAAAAAAANNRNNNNNTNSNSSSSNKTKTQTVYASGPGSELGIAVANYALQFNGNPYVYGGTSLTNGADCSGFVLSVYKHFGVSLPHSANADRKQGYEVEGGLANAQPGDLVCYSGHVGIYIGNNQIIHASTTKTGIKISNADYRAPLAVRRIF